MISADVKSNIKQQEIKDLVAASYKLQIIRKSTFKISNKIKRVCIFHLILVGIPSILILPVKTRGGRGRSLLNRQISLRVTKEVICQHSLNL